MTRGPARVPPGGASIRISDIDAVLALSRQLKGESMLPVRSAA